MVAVMTMEQAKTLDALLRAAPLDLGGDLHLQRPLLDELMSSHPLPEDIRTAPGNVGGVAGFWVEHNASAGDEPVVLYFHGGAYALGSAMGGVGLAADIAEEAGARAFSVEYRLAPEDPFPAAIDDAIAAYQGLVHMGVPRKRIVVVGESAGGGLSVAMLIALRDRQIPLPAAAVVLSPWADLTLSGHSVTARAADDPALTAEGLRRRAADYVHGLPLANPLISPVFADLGGLPPLLIQVGTHEILLDDAIRLASQAARDDVTVLLDVTANVPHVFQGFASVLDEGRQALGRVGQFIRQHVTSVLLEEGSQP